MDLYLNNTLLPAYNTFRENPTANVAKNVTLDGQLHVDIVNNRRSWTVSWENMTAANYAIVRAFYDAQFSSGSGNLTRFWCNGINLSVSVYINISERKMKYSNRLVEVTEIVLEEQYAVS